MYNHAMTSIRVCSTRREEIIDITAQVQKAVEKFVHEKVGSEWHGLKLARISKATTAVPPERRFVRGTIEEILGSRLDRG